MQEEKMILELWNSDEVKVIESPTVKGKTIRILSDSASARLYKLCPNLIVIPENYPLSRNQLPVKGALNVIDTWLKKNGITHLDDRTKSVIKRFAISCLETEYDTSYLFTIAQEWLNVDNIKDEEEYLIFLGNTLSKLYENFTFDSDKFKENVKNIVNKNSGTIENVEEALTLANGDLKILSENLMNLKNPLDNRAAAKLIVEYLFENKLLKITDNWEILDSKVYDFFEREKTNHRQLYDFILIALDERVITAYQKNIAYVNQNYNNFGDMISSMELKRLLGYLLLAKYAKDKSINWKFSEDEVAETLVPVLYREIGISKQNVLPFFKELCEGNLFANEEILDELERKAYITRDDIRGYVYGAETTNVSEDELETPELSKEESEVKPLTDVDCECIKEFVQKELDKKTQVLLSGDETKKRNILITIIENCIKTFEIVMTAENIELMKNIFTSRYELGYIDELRLQESDWLHINQSLGTKYDVSTIVDSEIKKQKVYKAVRLSFSVPEQLFVILQFSDDSWILYEQEIIKYFVNETRKIATEQRNRSLINYVVMIEEVVTKCDVSKYQDKYEDGTLLDKLAEKFGISAYELLDVVNKMDETGLGFDECLASIKDSAKAPEEIDIESIQFEHPTQGSVSTDEQVSEHDDKLVIKQVIQDEEYSIKRHSKAITGRARKKVLFSVITGVGIVSCIYLVLVERENPVEVISNCKTTFTNLFNGNATFDELAIKLKDLGPFFLGTLATMFGSIGWSKVKLSEEKQENSEEIVEDESGPKKKKS